MQTMTGPPRPVAPPPTGHPVTLPVRAPWWGRRGVQIVAVLAALVGVVALVAGLVAYRSSSSTRSEADDTAAEAVAVEQDAADAEAALEEAQQTVEQIVPLTNAVADAARELETAIQQGVDRWNELDDLFVQAIQQINAGDVAGGQALMANQGRSAVEAFTQAVDRELAAVAQLRAAVSDYEEAMG